MLLFARGAPFAVVNDKDQGGVLWVTSALVFSYFMLCAICRVYISFRSFQRDAIMLLVATAFGFAQTMAVFAQLSAGFGKSIELLDPSQMLGIDKAGYVADIFFILTLSAAKCSVAWLIARLNPNSRHEKLCVAIFWTSIVWGVASIFAIALRCDLARPWVSINAQCTGLLVRWQCIIAFDIVTELALLGVTVYLVWDLQMRRRKKSLVVLGFAFRLPLIALGLMRAYYLSIALVSTNQTLDEIRPSILESVQLGWCLISATIPCLRAFVSNVGSGFLSGNLNQSAVDSRGYTIGNSYVMEAISVSQQVRSKVTSGRNESNSTRSLTRTSHDDVDSNGIRVAKGYQVGFENPEKSGTMKARAA